MSDEKPHRSTTNAQVNAAKSHHQQSAGQRQRLPDTQYQTPRGATDDLGYGHSVTNAGKDGAQTVNRPDGSKVQVPAGASVPTGNGQVYTNQNVGKYDTDYTRVNATSTSTQASVGVDRSEAKLLTDVKKQHQEQGLSAGEMRRLPEPGQHHAATPAHKTHKPSEPEKKR